MKQVKYFKDQEIKEYTAKWIERIGTGSKQSILKLWRKGLDNDERTPILWTMIIGEINTE